MTKDKNPSVVDRIWDFMASIKLAIILFFLIAATSIVGTILEQQGTPEKNIEILTSLFGSSLAPTLYRVFYKLGFMDMYGSWWFVMMLMLFSANLIICSIDRFPAIWRIVKHPVKPLNDGQFRARPIKREVTLNGRPADVRDKVLAALGKAGFKRLNEVTEGGRSQYYAEKNRHSRLGVYVVHLSILVILGGAIIGGRFGFKGFVNIPEGSTYTVAFARTSFMTKAEESERNIIINAIENSGGDVALAASRLGVRASHLRARMRRLGVIALGFGLRLDDFDVDFYGRSDKPKEYSSVLTVVDGGREALRKRIEVNDPLVYKGITFYQSSYGLLPQSENYRFRIRAVSATGLSETKLVAAGEAFTIPGTDVELRVTDFSPALTFDQSGRPFTYTQIMNNPGVRMEVREGGSTYYKWVLKRYPETWSLTSGHSVQLADVWGAQYTGLQVRRDPGVWIVYLGCLLMSVGLYIAFFVNHRKVWVRISPSRGSTDVTVAATSNKNKEALERKIDKMISLLREGGQ